MKLPEVVLRLPQRGLDYSSCPEVEINGFRVPKVLRVQTDAPFDGVAVVTVTLLAAIRYDVGRERA